MPQTLKATKPIRAAVRKGKPLAVFMPWPQKTPFRILSHGKPYRSQEGRRTKTLVKHERLYKLRSRVRSIEEELDPTWGSAYDQFHVSGDLILDPHNLPAPHPEMERYSWFENHDFHDHMIFGQYTERGNVPGVNAPGRDAGG